MNFSSRSFVFCAFFGAAVASQADVFAPRHTLAQPQVKVPSKADKAAADALFREGKTLLKDGQTAEACAKFEESQSLDPSAGTLLNLGDCYEKAGLLVKSYQSFVKAEPMSKAREKMDWVETAQTRAAGLKAKIPTLSMDLGAEQTITVDGAPFKRDELRAGIMLEAGEHRVAVLYQSQTWNRVFRAEVGSRTVLRPEFKESAQPKPASGGNSHAGLHPMQLTGIVLMGVAGASVATGLVLGALASGKKSDTEALCPNYKTADKPLCTSASATDLNQSAKGLALGATIVTTAGLAVGVGGVLLFLLAPNATKGVAVEVGPGRASASWKAEF
jgi:hypothetical protein